MESGKGMHPPAWSRPLRRFFRPFLSVSARKRILSVIAEEEGHTTGKIVVQIIPNAGRHHIMAVAEKRFSQAGLDQLPGGNGVLLLVSHLDHQFALWRGAGVEAKTDPAFWNRAADNLTRHFAERQYAVGIEACVREIGQELSRLFPTPT